MDKAQVTLAQVDVSDISANQDILTAAKGSGILLVGRGIEQGSQVIFAILLARTLGAAGYGLYNVGIGIVLILAAIAALGLDEGMVRFLPIGLGERNVEKVKRTLFIGIVLSSIIGVVVGIICFSLGRVLATNLFHEPSATPVIRLLSITIPLEAVGRVLLGVAIGLKRADYQVYAYSIGFSLVRLVFTALFLFIGLDVTGVIIAYSLAWVVTLGILMYLISRVVSLRAQTRVSRKDIKELVSFSAPLALTEITIQLRGYIDLLLISAIGTLASVGVYSAATRVQTVSNMLLAPIAMIAKPIIADLDHQAETMRLNRLYQTLTRWSLSMILPLVATIILYPKPILSIFGDEFVIGVPVLMILGVGMLINAATRICHSMISMTGHSGKTFIITLIGLILNVILDIILIPRWGIVGSAIGTLLVIATLGIIRLIQVYSIVGLWPYSLAIVKPLIAAAIALVTGFLSNLLLPAENNFLLFILDLIILWASYIIATLLLGLSEEDRVVLTRVTGRFRIILSR